MVTDATDSRRSDLRPVTAGTTLRFTQLLILLFVASAAAAWNFGDEFRSEVFAGCALAGGLDPAQPRASFFFSVLGENNGAYQSCIEGNMPQLPLWLGPAWAVLVTAVAMAVFRFLPSWRLTRRSRAVPLEELRDGRKIRDRLDRLASELGVPRVDRVVIDPTARTTGAVVFGRNGHPILRLHGALLPLIETEPDRFRSVVAHEYAHIRNRDLSITHATIALAASFILLGFAPVAVFHMWHLIDAAFGPWPLNNVLLVLRDFAAPALVTTLAYLASCDVLRTREHCADLTASNWGVDSTEVFRSKGDARLRSGRLRRPLASFAELWRTHPGLERRREILVEPSELFEPRPFPLLLTGMAGAVVSNQVYSSGVPLRGVWMDLAAALLAAGLVVAILATVLWPLTYPTERRRPRIGSGIRIGLWLGIGMAVGRMVEGGGLQGLPPNPEFLLVSIPVGVCLVWWAVDCLRAWLLAVDGRDPRPAFLLVTAGAWLLLTALMSVWGRGPGLLLHGWTFDASSIAGIEPYEVPHEADGRHATEIAVYNRVSYLWVQLFDGTPILWIGLTALWVVPLLAWTVRPRQGGEAIPRLRPALLAGLIGGAASWAASIAVLAHMSPWLPFGPHQLATYQLWAVVAALFGAAVAATVTGLRSRWPRLLHSFIAVHLALVLGIGGAIALMAADGCIPPLAASRAECGDFPIGTFAGLYAALIPGIPLMGTMIALAVALTFESLRRLFRRPEPIRCARARPSMPRRAGVTALCSLGIGFAIVAAAEDGRGEAADGGLPEFDPAAAVEVSPEALPFQVEAWREYGGDELLARLGEVLDDLQNPAGDVDRDLNGVRVACQAALDAAGDASDYFAVPDPPIHELWHETITELEEAATRCVNALDRRNLAMLDESLSVLDTLPVRLSEVKTALEVFQSGTD